MKANISRGLKRLGIVIAIPWYLLWVPLGIASYRNIDANRIAAEKASHDGDFTLAPAFMQGSERASDTAGYALLATVIGPLVCVALFFISRWIVRGFKNESTTA